MSQPSQSKCKARRRQTEQRGAEKADALLSTTHRFNRVAEENKHSIVTKNLVRVRLTGGATMGDKGKQREVVSGIRSWTSAPSPLQSATTQEEAAVEALRTAAKLAKCPFDDNSSSDEDDLEAFKEQCRRWNQKGKTTAETVVKKAAKPETRTERRKEVLREILKSKAEKQKREACGSNTN